MKVCSFCGMPLTNKYYIEGIKGYICSDCLDRGNEVLEQSRLMSNIKKNKQEIKSPYELKQELDKYVIGQEEAKKILSIAVYNHYKRINYRGNVEIQKSNIFLIGPTGSGKTYLMEVLAKILDLPMVIVDATTFTEAGYVGEDVDSILRKLLQKTDWDVEKAQTGIVYVDEVDKIAKNPDVRGRDVNGEGVQRAFLKIMEGCDVEVEKKDDIFDKQRVTINTKNILFVFGGAFVGLNKIVEERTNVKKQNSIGFINQIKNENNEVIKEIIQDDLIKYGFIEEFVGRVPIIVELNKLTKEDLKEILTKPKNAILKQYEELLKMDGIKVKFDNEVIDYIAELAFKKNMGARGLKSIIEKNMLNYMFEISKNSEMKNKEVVITKELFFNNNEKIFNIK